MALGVRNRIRMKMLGIPMTVTSETIEWEPAERSGRHAPPSESPVDHPVE
jgi:hypothetical protein